MTGDRELLLGLSDEELVALAEGLLAPASHHRLDELLARNSAGRLSAVELAELDSLLATVDQLNILKTRALLTLRQQKAGAGGN